MFLRQLSVSYIMDSKCEFQKSIWPTLLIKLLHFDSLQYKECFVIIIKIVYGNFGGIFTFLKSVHAFLLFLNLLDMYMFNLDIHLILSPEYVLGFLRCCLYVSMLVNTIVHKYAFDLAIVPLICYTQLSNVLHLFS